MRSMWSITFFWITRCAYWFLFFDFTWCFLFWWLDWYLFFRRFCFNYWSDFLDCFVFVLLLVFFFMYCFNFKFFLLSIFWKSFLNCNWLLSIKTAFSYFIFFFCLFFSNCTSESSCWSNDFRLFPFWFFHCLYEYFF